ncbi:hypothetical protein ANANG_G00121110, partial [Anguilla anguilla]
MVTWFALGDGEVHRRRLKLRRLKQVAVCSYNTNKIEMGVGEGQVKSSLACGHLKTVLCCALHSWGEDGNCVEVIVSDCDRLQNGVILSARKTVDLNDFCFLHNGRSVWNGLVYLQYLGFQHKKSLQSCSSEYSFRSFQVVHASLLIFFPIKDHELYKLN